MSTHTHTCKSFQNEVKPTFYCVLVIADGNLLHDIKPQGSFSREIVLQGESSPGIRFSWVRIRVLQG
jgi:hypothetical protein